MILFSILILLANSVLSIGMGNNPMVGATVAVAVAVENASK